MNDEYKQQEQRAFSVISALELMIDHTLHATHDDLLAALALCGLVLKPGESIRIRDISTLDNE
jgi:hypothetical protein